MSSSIVDFQAVFEHAPDRMTLMAPDFTLVAATDAFLAATGITREACVGRSAFDIFPDNPDNQGAFGRQTMRASLDRVLTTKRTDEMGVVRYDLEQPGGGFEVRYWRPTNVPVLGPDGEVAWLLHRVEDVTAAVELDATKAERDRLFELASDLMGVMTLDGRLTRINPAFSATLGWPDEAILARPLAAFVHPDDAAAVEAALAHAATGHPTIEVEHRFRAQDGRYRVLSWRGRREGDRLYAVARDVTVERERQVAAQRASIQHRARLVGERQAARQHASESEAHFHRVVMALEEGLVVHDMDARILDANPAAERMLGLTREQLIGMTPFDPHWRALDADGKEVPPERHPSALTARTGDAQHGVEMGVCKPDGTETWLLVNTQLLRRSEDAEPYGFISSFMDITERRRAQAAHPVAGHRPGSGPT